MTSKFFSTTKLFYLSFYLLVAGFIAIVTLRLILIFSFVPEIGGISINVVFGMIRFLNDFPLYSDPQLPPYAVNQYMPLQYHIVFLLGKLFSIGDNVHAVIVLNRFLCFIFDLISMTVIYKMLSEVFSIQNAKIKLAVCICFFMCLTNAFYNRVDNLYLLNFLLGLYFFAKFVAAEENKTRHLILSSVFASISFFAKQTALFEIAAFSIYLIFFIRNWNYFKIFSLSIIISFALLFLILIPLHGIFPFYQNVVLGVKNGVDLKWFYQLFVIRFFLRFYIFIAFGFTLSVISVFNKDNQLIKFLGFFTLTILLLSFIASLKWGSDLNYFTEFMVLSFILMAYYFSKPEHIFIKSIFAFYVALHFIFLYVPIGSKGWVYLPVLKKDKNIYASSVKVANYVQSKMHSGEYVLSGFHVENLLNILLYKHSLYPTIEISKHDFKKGHVFSYDDFPKRLEKGEIKFWIGQEGQIPDTFLNVNLRQSFVPDTLIDGFSVYAYAPRK